MGAVRVELRAEELLLGHAEELLQRLEAELAAPFDMAAPPLLRALLLRHGGKQHTLSITLHHSVRQEAGVLSLAAMAPAATLLLPAQCHVFCS